MRKFWQQRVVGPTMALLKQGLTPEKLALTIALGIGLGIIPVLGSTSLACALAAFAFGLNQPAIQAVNYLVYPLQIALLIPFLKLGSTLFGASPVNWALSEITAMVRADALGTIRALWSVTWHAVVAWFLVAIPLVLILFIVLRPLLRIVAKRQEVV